MSLKPAVAGHQPLRDVATLCSREAASGLLRAIQLSAGCAPTTVASSNYGGRSQASRKLRAIEPLPSGFGYAEDQLSTTAVTFAPGLKVSRQYDE